MSCQTQLSNHLHSKSSPCNLPILWLLPLCTPWHLYLLHSSEATICHSLDSPVNTAKARIPVFGISNIQPRTVPRVGTYKYLLNPFLISDLLLFSIVFVSNFYFCLSNKISSCLKPRLYYVPLPLTSLLLCCHALSR